jgi:hypothetical protein
LKSILNPWGYAVPASHIAWRGQFGRYGLSHIAAQTLPDAQRSGNASRCRFFCQRVPHHEHAAVIPDSLFAVHATLEQGDRAAASRPDLEQDRGVSKAALPCAASIPGDAFAS